MTSGAGASAYPPSVRLDDAMGRLIESVIRGHHERRLRRIGWSAALEPTQESMVDVASFPVRGGNSVEILVDGQEAFAGILALVEGARRSVHVAGWHATPDFELTRGSEPRTLADALRHAAERAEVRVLLWGGAELPVIRPTRADARRARDAFAAIPGVSVALDKHEYLQHCHHEKLVIVDGEVAFVGGLDMTFLTSDRWDTSRHQPRHSLGWHDAATRVEGPVVADVASHFIARWSEVTGEHASTSARTAGWRAHEVSSSGPSREDLSTSSRAASSRSSPSTAGLSPSAQHLIYLENQFLWAPEIVDILEDKLLRTHREPDFRMILLLPSHPSSGRDTTLGQLSRLVQADGDHRLLPATLQPMTTDSPGTYVHAKVGIVDDSWLTVGSANLNAHSLFNDTEANVVITDPDLVRRTRGRLWAEHLGTDDVEKDTAGCSTISGYGSLPSNVPGAAMASRPLTDSASSTGCPLGATSCSVSSSACSWTAEVALRPDQERQRRAHFARGGNWCTRARGRAVLLRGHRRPHGEEAEHLVADDRKRRHG
jgi:phosphatidylserine/phosphatidylglycerophosphate/cardiolipin synthase-like enzyme